MIPLGLSVETEHDVYRAIVQRIDSQKLISKTDYEQEWTRSKLLQQHLLNQFIM